MTSTARNYFVEMYAQDPDPWGFATRWYERRKYAVTMAALPRVRYTNAFEPGCSIGVLSELLALRCDQLFITDLIPAALAQARARLQTYTNVEIGALAIPDEWPEGSFDLIVLSELAYYFDPPTLQAIVGLAIDSSLPGAHIVGVHWRGTTDYPLSGDQAHRIIGSHPHLGGLVHHEEEEFILDVWECVP
jgi:SAM-dependent methyltransferase